VESLPLARGDGHVEDAHRVVLEDDAVVPGGGTQLCRITDGRYRLAAKFSRRP
jgi:hypothetical protein